jgi:integrase/recombinase XerD
MTPAPPLPQPQAAPAATSGAGARAGGKPAGLPMGAEEAAQRAHVLAAGGPLAAGMRALEARTWREPGWLPEIWLWVLFLVVVRGFRGRTTASDYVHAIGRFADWLDSTGGAYATLDHNALDTWQKWLYLHRRNGAPARRAALMAVRSFYRWRSTRRGGEDITAGYAGPKRCHKTPRKYSTEELRKLFAAAKKIDSDISRQRAIALLLVLLASGLRREEIATLRVDQIELRERLGMIRCLGKGAKERAVPLEGPVVSTLQTWLAMRADIAQCDHVFVNLSPYLLGQPISTRTVEQIVARCAKAAELREWGVHRFRVTFATLLYDDDVDIERIRILMGHESIETTRGYLAVSARMNRFRLKAHRQHAALGTVPADLPLWAQALEKKKHGTGIL